MRYKKNGYWYRTDGRGRTPVFVPSDIPAYYVTPTDSDFTWIVDSQGYSATNQTQLGFYKYTGTDDYIILPETINGWTVTNTKQMFYVRSILGVATANENLLITSYMFYRCTTTSLELTYFKTTNVTAMREMFRECNNITSLDLTSFRTTNVTTMQSMFNFCTTLATLDVSSFDTSIVTNMQNMFDNCRFTSVSLPNFNTANVSSFILMFARCSNVVTFDLSSFDTSGATLSNASQMFGSCTSATTGYARTQADADFFNATSSKPIGLTFVVGP